MKSFLKILSLFLLLTSVTNAKEVKVFEFTEIELSELEVRRLEGQTIKQNTQLAPMIMVIF